MSDSELVTIFVCVGFVCAVAVFFISEGLGPLLEHRRKIKEMERKVKALEIIKAVPLKDVDELVKVLETLEEKNLV